MNMRPLTPVERKIVGAIIDKLPMVQRVLIDIDVARSKVIDVAGDGSRLEFAIEGYERPLATGQHPFPIEGTMKDSDGADLYVTLYADKNDRLFELEIIRWGGGPLIGPVLSSLSTF